MRWIYFAILAVLGIVFWRRDVQLVDLIFNAHLKWSLAAALFLGGIIAGQFIIGQKANLDTGASLVLLNYETATAAGIETDTLDYNTPVRTASGLLDIATVTLSEIRIGTRIVATEVEAAVTPKGLDHSNLLGSSFLSQLDGATIANGQVILKQTR